MEKLTDLVSDRRTGLMEQKADLENRHVMNKSKSFAEVSKNRPDPKRTQEYIKNVFKEYLEGDNLDAANRKYFESSESPLILSTIMNKPGTHYEALYSTQQRKQISKAWNG